MQEQEQKWLYQKIFCLKVCCLVSYNFIVNCASWNSNMKEHYYHEWERIKPSHFDKMCDKYINSLLEKIEEEVKNKRKERKLKMCTAQCKCTYVA